MLRVSRSGIRMEMERTIDKTVYAVSVFVKSGFPSAVSGTGSGRSANLVAVSLQLLA